MAQGKRGMNKDGVLTDWSTKREISYLDKIGKSKDGVGTVSPSLRLKLLNNYRKATASRGRWGQIDRAQIAAYLDFEINILLVSGVML